MYKIDTHLMQVFASFIGKRVVATGSAKVTGILQSCKLVKQQLYVGIEDEEDGGAVNFLYVDNIIVQKLPQLPYNEITLHNVVSMFAKNVVATFVDGEKLEGKLIGADINEEGNCYFVTVDVTDKERNSSVEKAYSCGTLHSIELAV